MDPPPKKNSCFVVIVVFLVVGVNVILTNIIIITIMVIIIIIRHGVFIPYSQTVITLQRLNRPRSLLSANFVQAAHFCETKLS